MDFNFAKFVCGIICICIHYGVGSHGNICFIMQIYNMCHSYTKESIDVITKCPCGPHVTAHGHVLFLVRWRSYSSWTAFTIPSCFEGFRWKSGTVRCPLSVKMIPCLCATTHFSSLYELTAKAPEFQMLKSTVSSEEMMNESLTLVSHAWMMISHSREKCSKPNNV